MITITCLILWMPAGGVGFRLTTVLSPRVAALPLEPSAPAATSTTVRTSFRRAITGRSRTRFARRRSAGGNADVKSRDARSARGGVRPRLPHRGAGRADLAPLPPLHASERVPGRDRDRRRRG